MPHIPTVVDVQRHCDEGIFSFPFLLRVYFIFLSRFLLNEEEVSAQEVAVKSQGIPKPGLGVNAIGVNHDNNHDHTI